MKVSRLECTLVDKDDPVCEHRLGPSPHGAWCRLSPEGHGCPYDLGHKPEALKGSKDVAVRVGEELICVECVWERLFMLELKDENLVRDSDLNPGVENICSRCGKRIGVQPAEALRS